MIDPKQISAQPTFSLSNVVGSLVINPATKILFPAAAVIFDSHGWWDTTNNWYRPQMAGKYWFYADMQAGAAPPASGEYLQTSIFKNESSIVSPFNYFGTTNQQHMQAFVILDLNGTTDYVYITGGTSHASGDINNRLFMGGRIGS